MKLDELKEQARRHEQKEEWQKALDLYRAALREHEKDETPDITLFNRVGDIQTRLGQTSGAVEHYERAIDLYIEAELPNNAIAICKKVLRHLPDRARFFLRMGQIRASQGFLTDARHNFLTFAERATATGDIEAALNALVEFVELSPDDVEIRLALAGQLESHEREEEAVEQYIEAYRRLILLDRDEEAESLAAKIGEIAPDATLPDPDEVREASAAEPVEGLVVETTSLGGLELRRWDEPDEDEAGSGATSATEIPGEDEAADDAGEEPTVAVGAEDALAGFGTVDLPDTDAGVEEDDRDVPLFGSPDGGLELEEEEEEEGTATELDADEMEELPTFDFEAEEEEEEEEPEPLPMLEFDDEPEDLGVALEDGFEGEPAGPTLEEELEEEELEEEELQEEELQEEELQEEEFSSEAREEAFEEALAAPIPDAGGPGAQTSEELSIAPPEEVEEEVAPLLPSDHRKAADRGDLDLALDMVRVLIQSDPDDVENYQRLVEYAFRKGETPVLVAAYLELAGYLRRSGATGKARAVFQQVLSLSPGNPDAAAALRDLDGEPAAAPPSEVTSTEEYVDLGAMILGEEAEKTTRWTVAADAPSGDEEADFAKMLSQFKEKVSEHVAADDVSAHHDLGTAYMEMGLLEEAISEFQMALRASPRHLPTHEVMGRCWMEKGEPELAVRALQRALDVDSGIEDELIGIYYLMGRAKETLGKIPEALEFYEKVFSLDINFRDVTERLRALR